MMRSKTDIIKELDKLRDTGYFILEKYSLEDSLTDLQEILLKYKKLYLNQTVEFSDVIETHIVETNNVKSDIVETNNVKSDIVETNNVKSDIVESNNVKSDIVETSVRDTIVPEIRKTNTVVIENNNQIQIIDKQIQVINNNKQAQIVSGKNKQPFYDENEVLEPTDALVKNFLTGLTKNMIRNMSKNAKDDDEKGDIHELVEITSRGIDLFVKRMKPKNTTSSKHDIGGLAAKAATMYGYKKLMDMYRK
jgi:hypothetical protein